MFMGHSQKLKHSVGFEPIHLTPAKLSISCAATQHILNKMDLNHNPLVLEQLSYQLSHHNFNKLKQM